MDSPSPHPMTVAEARKRLGLAENDCLAESLPHWKEVEDRLATMVETAGDPETKAAHQRDLDSLREVLAVLEEQPKAKKRSKAGLLVWLLFVGLLAAGGFYGYQKWAGLDLGGGPNKAKIQQTLSEFDQAIEKRRWDEAGDLIDQLRSLGSRDKQIKEALAQIEQGKVEEKGQQIAFLIGNAQSALEAGQLGEAESFCSQVEELQPDHPQLSEIRSLIQESQREVRSLLMVREIEKAIKEDNLQVAGNQLSSLVSEQPQHPAILKLKARLEDAKMVLKANRARAAELLSQARVLDQGVYSAEAIALLEEAVRLDPSEEIRAIYKRMSEYGKVMRVPSEYATIGEALKDSKPNDRIFVEKGTYTESLIVPQGVEIVGESRATTIIECPAEKGAVISVIGGEKKVRVAALTLRHQGLVNDEERFSIVAVDGGSLLLEDVLVSRASGHGVAILNGGEATLLLCQISESGWDGVSVKGEKSSVVMSKVTSEGNLQHGVDFWDGASGQVSQSQFLSNNLSGLTAIDSLSPITVSECRAEGNREIGLFFSGVSGATVINCDALKNKLGGIVFDRSSKAIKITNSRVIGNGKAGVVFERGVEVLVEEENTVEKNEDRQIWSDAVFAPRADEDTITPPPPAPPVAEEEKQESPEKDVPVGE